MAHPAEGVSSMSETFCPQRAAVWVEVGSFRELNEDEYSCAIVVLMGSNIRSIARSLWVIFSDLSK